MAWKDLASPIFKYTDKSKSYHSGITAACLQYDDSSETPESVRVRFKYYRLDGLTGSNGNLHDSIYILYNASSSERTLMLIKKYTGNSSSAWPYYSDSFVINKTYNASTFALQDFWICNNGWDAVAITASTFYNEDRFASSWYSCQVAKTSFSVENTVATDVGNGTITITDHGNNSFSISGTKGADGTNNPSTGPTISWGYNTSYSNSGAVSRQTLNIDTPANATKTVYAKCITGATYGTNKKTVTTSTAVKQYVAPGNPGKPNITISTSQPTLDERWAYSWTAAAAANSSSPIKGYRIRVYKNGSTITGLAYDSTNKVISIGSNTNPWVDTEETSTRVSFDPVELGFKVGDKVKISLFAYSRNANGSVSWTIGETSYTLYSGNGSTQIYSDELTVANSSASGIYTNVNGTWKEGKVFVNVKGTWKEAESIHTNVGGTWKEAQ